MSEQQDKIMIDEHDLIEFIKFLEMNGIHVARRTYYTETEFEEWESLGHDSVLEWLDDFREEGVK